MTPQPKASSEPKERTERLTHAHAHTCEGSGPNGSGPVTVSKKPFAVAIQESEIQELQTKYRPLDVQTLLPEAAAKCADKYPGGGPMKREFFERYLDRCQEDLPPPGLVEGQRIKAEVLAEASRDREEFTPEIKDEHRRADLVAGLQHRFPQINPADLAQRYAQECEVSGTLWNDKVFMRRVGEAQAGYETSLRESRP